MNRALDELDAALVQHAKNHRFSWVDANTGERIDVPASPSAAKRNHELNRRLRSIGAAYQAEHRAHRGSILRVPLGTPAAAHFAICLDRLDSALRAVCGAARLRQRPAIDWTTAQALLTAAVEARNEFLDAARCLRSSASVSHGEVRIGWTKLDLTKAAGISGPTFNRIREKSKIEAPPRGKRGFRFKAEMLKRLIATAASVRGKVRWQQAAERWRVILDRAGADT